MRQVRCNLEGVSISYREFSRALGRGAVVDLDEVVGRRPPVVDAEGRLVEPARDMRVEDLLQGRLECFSPVEPESSEHSVPEPSAAAAPTGKRVLAR